MKKKLEKIEDKFKQKKKRKLKFEINNLSTTEYALINFP